MGNPFNVIHPHISQKTEGFIPAAVDASYIILIDLQANNTSRLVHNRGCGQGGGGEKKLTEEVKDRISKEGDREKKSKLCKALKPF